MLESRFLSKVEGLVHVAVGWGPPQKMGNERLKNSVLITTFFFIFCSPPSSVVFWLRELCLVHEAECTIMLQSKPVGGSTGTNGADGAGVGSTYNQTHLGNFWAGNSKDTIRAVQSRAHAISAVFAKLCK